MNTTENNSELLNLETAHSTFKAKSLESFKNLELESGQYLVRKIARKGKDGEKEAESIGVVITAVDAEGFIKSLESDVILEAATDWLNSLRGEVAKGLISKAGDEIGINALSVDAVADYLLAQAVSEGRVSAEKVKNWFASQVESMLSDAFAAKLGTQWTETTARQTLNCYRDSFASLTKTKITLSNEAKDKLKKVMTLKDGLIDSGIGKYVWNKLNEEVKEETIEMLGL